jgi:hypothetical protein
VAVRLASGFTVSAAAEASGVSAATAHRWLAEPDFKARVAELRATAVGRAIAILGEASAKACATLAELLGAGTAPGIRLSAARSIVELCLKGREALELEERLQALEQRQAEAEQRGRRRA